MKYSCNYPNQKKRDRVKEKIIFRFKNITYR